MKKILCLFVVVSMFFTILSGCSNNNASDNDESEKEDNGISISEEANNEPILADPSRKAFVNDCTRGYYYTFDLGNSVEAEYSFNDGVAQVTTFLYGEQFGAIETGSYEIYEDVLICNFGHGDVIIEYKIVNNDVEFTKIR